MQTEKRQSASGVIRQLLDEPAPFQFRQALRLLLVWLRARGVSYEEAFKHVLRFQNSVSLGFPPSEIEALRADLSAPEHVAMTPAFIGLLGANGTLPFHYSERIGAQQLHEKDDSARAFLDILSNRMIGLFYEAWGKYRLESKVDTQGVDPLRGLLMQLGGFKGADYARRDRDENEVLACYASAFRSRPTSAFTVAAVLSEHFCVPVRIEQFVGSWDYLGKHQRTVLGRCAPTLGLGATLGQRLWRCDRRLRLHIGPLNKAELDRFLPRGEAATALATMLRHFGIADLEIEVRLVLKPACIRPIALSARRPEAMRLGWDSFLTTVQGRAARGDVGYLLALRPNRSASKGFESRTLTGDNAHGSE